MIKKAVKGTFGYLDAQKKRVFLRTVIYFAIPSRFWLRELSAPEAAETF